MKIKQIRENRPEKTENISQKLNISNDKERGNSELEVKDFIITEDCQIIEAIQHLDIVGKKILFLVRDKKLIGTLTDGDIRRWLLKKGNLEVKVKEIANFQPKYILEKNKLNAHQKLREWSVDAIPIVNEEKQIISIILRNHQEIGRGRVLDLPVVIMAGGLGTRLYPYTKILPKPLIPVGELPIAEHIINRFHKFGIDEFYLVVNHKKNMIKAYFNEISKDYQLHYVDEEKPLGTGGGLSLLKGKINSTFILSNCDILVEEDFEKIYQYHKKNKNIITMVCANKKMKIPYGVVESNELGKILGLKEKPELSFLVNTGFYLVESQVLENLKENIAIEFPEIIEEYRSNKFNVGTFIIDEEQWLDMGQLEEMKKMEKYLEGVE